MESINLKDGRITMEEPMIVSNPKIMVGKPVIRGTRITVELILNKLAAGQTVEQILDGYPYLTREGIRAALKFAAESVHFDHVTPPGTSTEVQDEASH
jgi:uncharacterized protein (DUF433 family)